MIWPPFFLWVRTSRSGDELFTTPTLPFLPHLSTVKNKPSRRRLLIEFAFFTVKSLVLMTFRWLQWRRRSHLITYKTFPLTAYPPESSTIIKMVLLIFYTCRLIMSIVFDIGFNSKLCYDIRYVFLRTIREEFSVSHSFGVSNMLGWPN